jgi:hypothetical protein
MLAVHCWPRRTPDDDTVAVYDDHDTVLITHDREFRRRHGEHDWPTHVPRVRATRRDGRRWPPLDEIVEALEHAHDVVIVVSVAGVTRSAWQWE